MNIAGLCQRVIVTIDSGASLTDAAILMRDEHVGALVVTDGAEPPRVTGMLTDRDIIVGPLAEGLDPASIRVAQLASTELVTIPGEATVMEAVATMGRAGVRRLVVTGEDGRVIGFVATDDLVDGIAAELTGLASALRRGIDRETGDGLRDDTAEASAMFLPAGLLPGVH